MKVLFVSAYPGSTLANGVASACRNLAEGLVALGHDVAVISIEPQGASTNETVQDGVLVYRLPCAHPMIGQRFERATAFFHDRRAVLDLVKRRLGWRPDVIHGQDLGKQGVMAMHVSRQFGVPLVVTAHGAIDKELALEGAGVLRRWLTQRTMRVVRNASRREIVVSPHHTQESSPHESRPTVIRNAVWRGFHAATPDPTSRSVMYAGVFRKLKRLDTLIASFARLTRLMPGASLHVIGEEQRSSAGSFRALRSLIEQSGVGSRVTVSPPMDREGIRDALRRSRILALTSEQEDAPMIASEAQAVGIPVVATRVGGMPWLVNDGENGFLVDVGDAEGHAQGMATLLKDPDLWGRFSAAARRAGERFRCDVIAAQTAELYEAVCRDRDLA